MNTPLNTGQSAMNRAEICIPLIESSVGGMLAAAEKYENQADLFEIRLDYLRDFNIEKLLTAIKKPVIVSCGFTGRSREMDRHKKLCLLQNAAKLGARYVDIDFSLFKPDDKPFFVPDRTIVSYHNFDETPDDIEGTCSKMLNTHAGVIKIATKARSFSDNFKILPLIEKIRQKGKEAIVFCMGETGQFSRLLSPMLGAKLVYAASARGMESAPGQLQVQEYVKIYHLHELDSRTVYTGLIGNMSDYPPALRVFNALFKKQGCNFLFFPFLIKDIQDFFRVFREQRFAGVSIAYPYQQIVGRAIDRIGYPVRKTGLVTVAVKEGDLVKGYNSDVIAFQAFFEEDLSVAGKRCVVLGSAYRWRSLLYVLKKMKAVITILSEDKNQAKRLAQSVGCGYDHVQRLGRLDFDFLFLNSLVEQQTYVERLLEQPSKCRGRQVVDLGDFVGGGPLEREMKKTACHYQNGWAVLRRKIEYEFKLFTGREAPRDALARLSSSPETR